MELLKTEAEKFGIELSEKQLSEFRKYMELLLSFNEKMNLTAITEKNEVLIKHFLDSVTLLLSEKAAWGASLVDIGAGAGFPSLPLKLARPDLKITMLDSLNKRVGFLKTVISELGLSEIEALHLRAEDAGRSPLRESFDLAAARAVADLAVLAEYALPLVKPGGYFIAMKGTAPEAEIDGAKAAIRAMGGKTEGVVNVHIDEGDLNHSLVIIKKIKKTLPEFPRKAGKPSKEPIK